MIGTKKLSSIIKRWKMFEPLCSEKGSISTTAPETAPASARRAMSPYEASGAVIVIARNVAINANTTNATDPS